MVVSVPKTDALPRSGRLAGLGGTRLSPVALACVMAPENARRSHAAKCVAKLRANGTPPKAAARRYALRGCSPDGYEERARW